ncbi:MAG: hypothetical protein NZ951_06385 [Dehalococcoidia bacterium]|nr:hypothetical protein [Dehalococcoidia bacterium]MDW8120032.1 hypothetical protein [Chloroflexota bacterium]
MTLEARTLEERLPRLEAQQDATREMLQQITRRMYRLERRMDRLEDIIASRFRWLMGTLSLTWMTTIAAAVGTLPAALFSR